MAHLLKEEVATGNINKAKEIKILVHREIVRKTWSIIRSALHKKRGGSVSAVEICHNGIYHRYKGKERLEAGLQNSLSDRFKMTNGTHMRSGQLNQDFGVLGNTTAATKVLEVTYVAPEGSNESVVRMLKIIEEVAVGVKDRAVDILITLQYYIQYCTVCREKTSSSVSGIYFGYWKGHSVNQRGHRTSLNDDTNRISIREYSHTLVQSTTGDIAKDFR